MNDLECKAKRMTEHLQRSISEILPVWRLVSLDVHDSADWTSGSMVSVVHASRVLANISYNLTQSGDKRGVDALV